MSYLLEGSCEEIDDDNIVHLCSRIGENHDAKWDCILLKGDDFLQLWGEEYFCLVNICPFCGYKLKKKINKNE